jgi:uncharacterized protein DUF6599
MPLEATGDPVTNGLSSLEKRVLNPRPFRHYRKTYSLMEVRVGLCVLALLASIAAWISWRGSHPAAWVFGGVTPLDVGTGGTGTAAPSRVDLQAKGPGGAALARGPMPAHLAPQGWHEGPVARFNADNLYEKIDGRADYFLSRGFRSLACVTLEREGAGATVDLELYELSSAENALAALAGEKPPEVASSEASGTTWFAARNALCMARGSYYARILGSDESADVLAELAFVRRRLDASLRAGERASAGMLLQQALGVPADKVTYEGENAFSFGFARDVHVAALPDGETEAFLVQAPDDTSARALAARFVDGFAGYGEKVDRAGTTWIKDRYLGSFARATSQGRFVVGVRSAPNIEAGEDAIARLTRALASGAPSPPPRSRGASKDSRDG